MKIRFVTLGCKLNYAESSAIGQELLRRGHHRASINEVPDICIINTCSVTDNADHKDRQSINKIHRQFPNATIIVTGCYAQLQPKQVINLDGVDFVIGQNEKFDIPRLVDTLEQSSSNKKLAPHDINRIQVGEIRNIEECHMVQSGDERTRCFLKIQDGCNYFCTYCTIPYARGKSRNPSIVDIVKAASDALSRGVKELILTGINIGDFGQSTNENFIDLLKALDDIPFGESQYRIRISSCEPNLLTDEIIRFVANSRHFAPHFHIPLQSGCNEVLQIMKRRYTRELFAERIDYIHKLMPHAFIGVDCMVGVRGETNEYWEDYLKFIQNLDVSQLHVFTYSERANTRMIEMPLYIVPKSERQRRSKILRTISEEKIQAFYDKHKHRPTSVLWESKREGNMMTGFTDNYIKVLRPYDKSKINTFEHINQIK